MGKRHRHARDDLVDTVIAPASAEAAATAVSDIRENRERVAKYLARLKEVRHKRSAMQVCLLPNTLGLVVSLKPICYIKGPGILIAKHAA